MEGTGTALLTQNMKAMVQRGGVIKKLPLMLHLEMSLEHKGLAGEITCSKLFHAGWLLVWKSNLEGICGGGI